MIETLLAVYVLIMHVFTKIGKYILSPLGHTLAFGIALVLVLTAIGFWYGFRFLTWAAKQVYKALKPNQSSHSPELAASPAD